MSDITKKIETEQQPEELATKTEGELTEKDLAKVAGGSEPTSHVASGVSGAGAGKVTFKEF